MIDEISVVISAITLIILVINQFRIIKDKAYLKSPLGRIAIKFGHKGEELVNELYLEDMSLTLLNILTAYKSTSKPICILLNPANITNGIIINIK